MMLSSTQIQLVIFDLDGTLADTSTANTLAYKSALNHYHYDGDEELLAAAIRRGEKFHTFLPALNPKISADEARKVNALKSELYADYFEHIRPIQPTLAIAQACALAHIPLALYSNAQASNGKKVLEHLNLQPLFQYTLFDDDVVALNLKGKPAPDGYLHIMGLSGCLPHQTLIIEDSPTGLAAAQASGAHVLHYRQGNSA